MDVREYYQDAQSVLSHDLRVRRDLRGWQIGDGQPSSALKKTNNPGQQIVRTHTSDDDRYGKD